MQIKNSKPAIIGVGTFMAASLGVALSASIGEDADNLFVAESLDDIDVLTAEDEEASCGEGQCGDEDDDSDDEGECGEDEGGCGEGECGEEEGDDEDEDTDEEEEEETTEE